MGGLLKEFTIDQLAGSVALILGSLGGLLLIIWKSRCKKINCCYLLQCERQVNDLEDEEEKRPDKKEEEKLITDTALEERLNRDIKLKEELKRLALMNDKPNIVATESIVTPRTEDD